jgi:hypothetical protein
MLHSKSLRIAALLVAITWAGTAQAQQYYSVTGGGGQAQIGGGLPLPIQAATTGGTMMSPIGTGTMFPPLLIPLNANPAKRLVKQTAGPDPKKMTVPPSVFKRPGPGALKVGVALNNPKVFQVQTNLQYTGPHPAFGTMTFKAGGRTGAHTTTFNGIPAGAQIRYSKSAAQFGGPSTTKVVPITPIVVWANGGAMLPCKHPAFGGANASCVAPLLAAYPDSTAAAGAAVGFTNMTPGTPVPMSPNVVAVSVPNVMGTIAMSVNAGVNLNLTNMATSAGFPWTTGQIQISQSMAALTPEVFTITGMDSRMGGVGTLSLVSGALSNRKASGPNSNRSWARYTLPEPGAVLGAAAALAVLGICHGLVRRRSR